MHLKAEKIHYDFKNEPIDVVIPCSSSDISTLDLCIEGIQKNGKNIRRIIVISEEKITDQAEWFDEKNYPFQREDLCLAMFHGDQDKAEEYRFSHNRLNWIYQQFLKLYAYKVIPDISPNILIIDADTIFLNPIEFITPSGEPLFATSEEYMQPYFDHIHELIPHLDRQTKYSGITHHMLFQKPILDDLFQTIETIHHIPSWQAIAAAIQEYTWGCMSEYELYFNFILSKTDQAKIRPLKWKNSEWLHKLPQDQEKGYTFVSYHHWMRKDLHTTFPD